MTKTVGLSYEDVSGVLSYDAGTGNFLWKVATGTRSRAGDRAGVWQRMQNGKDYYSITYRGQKMSGGRAAWLLHYGEWPDRSVFYVDGDSMNLRIANLKLADHKAERIFQEDGSVKYKMTTGQARHYGLVRNYNISLTEYAQMFADQNGVCAICEQPERAKLPGRKTAETENRIRDLSVDHDHKTGAVRQLLCNSCNHVLGAAKDDLNILIAAADYLRRHLPTCETVVKSD